MHSNLKTFLPFLLFCAYGIVHIESLECNTKLDFSSKTAADVIKILKGVENDCWNAFKLAPIFESAYQTFQRNRWTDPDKYITHSRDYYQFLSDLNTALIGIDVLATIDYSQWEDFMSLCYAQNMWTQEGKNIIAFASTFNVHPQKDSTVSKYVEGNTITGDKATIFCRIVNDVLEARTCNLTTPNAESLRLSGNYLLISDVADEIRKYRKKDIRNIEIFASSRIIMDRDFLFPSKKSLNLIIMAPQWLIPPCRDYDCERWLEVMSDESQSEFFGAGYSFTGMKRFIIKIIPKPPSYNYETIYQLDTQSDVQLAANDFGEKIKEPSPAETGYDYHAGINTYIGFLLDKKTNGAEKDFLIGFYNYTQFKPSMFHTFGFARELLTLEDHFFDLYHKGIPANIVYTGLEKRFSDYSFSPRPNETSFEYNELRDSIRMAIWTKIDVITSNRGFEFDLVKFISEGVSSSMKMGDIQKREKSRQITFFREDMKAKIAVGIKQAETFIQEEVIPKVNELNEQVEMQLDNVVRAATAVRENVVQQVEERNRNLELVRFFTFIKTCGAVLAAVAGIVTGAGVVVAVAMGTAISSGLDIWAPQVSDVDVPDSVKKVRSYIDAKSRVLDRLLDIVDDKQPALLGSVRKEIEGTKSAMEGGSNAAPFEKIIKFLETKEKEFKASGSSGALDIVQKLQKILRLSEFATPDVYLKYQSDSRAIQVLDESSLLHGDSDVQAAYLYEQQVHNLIAPAVKYFSNFTAGLATAARGKSPVELEVWKWKANDILRDIRFRLQEFAFSMYEGKLLLETIEKLSSGLNLVFDLTNKISAFEQYAQLIHYIGDVNAVQYATREYENKEIEQAIAKLEYLTKYNMAIAWYKKALNSYKLYAFPFTPMLNGLTDFDFSEEYSMAHTVKDMAMKAEIQLGSMAMRMNRYKNSLTNNRDIHVMEGRFNGSSPSGEVFYTWNLGKGSSTLDSLFSGKEIALDADVKNGLKKNALKFNQIGIRFKAMSAGAQRKLDNALKSFEVALTHSGVSCYRCDDNFYKVTTRSTTILFSVKKNAAGEPLVKGDSYDKLLNGDYLLSPYTTWKIRLESADGSFSKLQALKKRNTAIILEGSGQYVKGRDSCDHYLRRYYELL